MMRPSSVLNARGRIGRGGFLAAGIVLFSTKFAIDFSVAHGIFGRHWSLIEYLAPGQAIASLLRDPAGRAFYLTMSAIALPYVVIGLWLTVCRLRDAGLPMWLVALFFLPVGNVIFFLALCLIPSRAGEGSMIDRTDRRAGRQADVDAAAAAAPSPPILLDYGRDSALFPRAPVLRWWPENDGFSFALAVLLPTPVMAGIVLFATETLQDYGWGLFIGLPFVNGMLSALLHGLRTPRTLRQCFGVGIVGAIVSAAAILLFAIEGLGCLIMFLPLALPIAMLGASFGYTIQRRPLPPGAAWRVSCSVLGILPLLMWAEHSVAPAAPVFAVTTAVEVDAPPEAVWRHVVSFSDIPPPNEWLFKTGVAYPMRARIEGRGAGAVRYCEFSTGAFVEPIEVWDTPRLLKFSVTQNPPPMKEWTLWSDIHPRHLDNFLVSQGGEFRLAALPGGRTRLEGTTWYRHNMWPASYWRMWSDFIIHRIHARVLDHVKALSEIGTP
jgi:uncharacterized membrane protein YhaH (DUF805 family)